MRGAVEAVPLYISLEPTPLTKNTMGVNGLHAGIKHMLIRSHVSSFKGSRAACDASSWMVKGGTTHAREIFTEPGYSKTPWTEYVVAMVRLLREHGVVPILVFDGKRHPLKQETSDQRRQHKEAARRDAEEAEAAGDIDRARSKWMQAFSLTSDMQQHTKDTLTELGVTCIDAESEADQTLAALSVTGQVDVVITEDGDLVAYGCPRILFKLRHDGEGDLFNVDSPVCTTMHSQKRQKTIIVDIKGLTKQQVAMLCVFSGNDYITNVSKGWGFKRVYSVIQHCTSIEDAFVEFQKRGLSISDEYKGRARACFRIFRFPQYYVPGKIGRLWLVSGLG